MSKKYPKIEYSLSFQNIQYLGIYVDTKKQPCLPNVTIEFNKERKVLLKKGTVKINIFL